MRPNVTRARRMHTFPLLETSSSSHRVVVARLPRVRNQTHPKLALRLQRLLQLRIQVLQCAWCVCVCGGGVHKKTSVWLCQGGESEMCVCACECMGVG